MSRNPHHELHVMFFPYMAYGHMIPTLDMAKLFSSKGVKSTIITTPLNSKIFQKPIDVFKNQNPSLEIIDIHIFDFPCVQLGLPEGCENVDFFTSSNNPGRENIAFKFLSSTRFFKDQLEKLLETTRPDCLIADMFFPWATQVAEKCHVPRLVFHGTGYFSLCANYCMKVHKPQNKVASSSEPFVIPDLPGDIEITREQIIDNESEMGMFLLDVRESETKSSGVIVNSFYELEPEYADFTRVLGFEEKAERGKKASVDESECLKWLDSKEKDSVIYISFGSVACFKNKQLVEIAAGLEACGASFIWVVRKSTSDDDKEEWLPEGFEERVKGRGMIIRGWAPQVLILEHQVTGGFLTHCGWNSLLEGVAAGLPMVTWPIGAEQFYNEKLVTQVLRTGVSVGTKQHASMGDFISRENLEKAVSEVLVGEEAEERRKRAKHLAEMAKAAVAEGGSSFNDLNNFIHEFSS
ncbi:hypothetical protein Bca52824_093543 [Brassica carinata]|uniref:Glycosyltransferase n=1 Tax=Brassica carinata TaxID=52824 RepID=A0A8X7P3U3_BRACI|nr:hypothetical protein Bca52824_093543 [Brassica carinata]